LGAVDAEVSRHIFDNCINGILKEKVRILVTHQVQYLSQSTEILLLFNGTTLVHGTYDELQEKNVDLDKISTNLRIQALVNETNSSSIGSIALIKSLSASESGMEIIEVLGKESAKDIKSILGHCRSAVQSEPTV
jgi:ATP-binding cassette subfamily C (CFTR/MRP) protein 4